MTLQVKQISSDEAKAHAFAIRMRVFVSEQGVPRDVELDDDDEPRFISWRRPAAGP